MLVFLIFALCEASKGLGQERWWGGREREVKSSSLDKRAFGLARFFGSRKSGPRGGFDWKPRPGSQRPRAAEKEKVGFSVVKGERGWPEEGQQKEGAGTREGGPCLSQREEGAHVCLPIVVGDKSVSVEIPVAIVAGRKTPTPEVKPPPGPAPAAPALPSTLLCRPEAARPPNGDAKKEQDHLHPPCPPTPQLNSISYQLLKPVRETSFLVAEPAAFANTRKPYDFIVELGPLLYSSKAAPLRGTSVSLQP